MSKRAELAVSSAGAPQGGARLGFLSEFMRLIGECPADIARQTGLTRGVVSRWFDRDDVRLSYCYSYIESRGYELNITLKKDQDQVKQGNLSIQIEQKAPDPDSVDCRRLEFLQIAMAKNGITKKDIADRIDIKYNTVRHWFIVDDMYLSYVFTIANLYGFDVNISIKPKEE